MLEKLPKYSNKLRRNANMYGISIIIMFATNKKRKKTYMDFYVLTNKLFFFVSLLFASIAKDNKDDYSQ